jgi:hypothetical protein
MTATNAQVRIMMRERQKGKTLEQAAAIDRVVHHATIIEFGPDISSYRAEQANRRQRRPLDAVPAAQPVPEPA